MHKVTGNDNLLTSYKNMKKKYVDKRCTFEKKKSNSKSSMKSNLSSGSKKNSDYMIQRLAHSGIKRERAKNSNYHHLTDRYAYLLDADSYRQSQYTFGSHTSGSSKYSSKISPKDF